MRTSDKILTLCAELKGRQLDLDAIVEVLHQAGLGKFETIQALVEAKIATLADAKRIVHFHEAWQDRREADERFHQELDTHLTGE